MLCEFGHFLGPGKVDGSVWLSYVYFSFIGFHSGATKAVEGIDSYAYLKYQCNVLSLIYFSYCCYYY
jgi:hypothetical protein